MLRIVIVSVFTFASTCAICQINSESTSDPNWNLGMDTLDIQEILLIEKDRHTIKFDYPPDIAFDTAQCELYLGRDRVAIVPLNLRRSMPEDKISETRFALMTLPDGRVLLRILKKLRG